MFLFDHEEKCQGDRCFFPFTQCTFCTDQFPTCTALEDHMMTRHPALVRLHQTLPEEKASDSDNEIVSILETELENKQPSVAQPGMIVSPRTTSVDDTQQSRQNDLAVEHGQKS